MDGLVIDIENQAAAAGRSGKVGLSQSGNGGGLSARNTAKTPGRRALGDITNSKRNAPASASKAPAGATPGIARKVQQQTPAVLQAAPVLVEEVDGATKLSTDPEAPFVDSVVEAGVQALLREPGAEVRGHLPLLPDNLPFQLAEFEEEAPAKTDEEVLGLLLEDDDLQFEFDELKFDVLADASD
jgi:hypothetical protein